MAQINWAPTSRPLNLVRPSMSIWGINKLTPCNKGFAFYAYTKLSKIGPSFPSHHLPHDIHFFISLHLLLPLRLTC